MYITKGKNLSIYDEYYLSVERLFHVSSYLITITGSMMNKFSLWELKKMSEI